MRSLREIGVLSGDWLEALVDEARPWAIESLAVELQREADSLLLSKATNLPTLRRLEVHSDHLDTVIAALPHASWWPQLERLSVVGGASLAVWHKRRQELRVPWLAVTAAHSDPTDALGWEIALGPNGACEVTLRGFTPHGTLARLGELLPGIPGVSSIKLVRSEFYVPSTVDIERLASATTHPITI